MCTPHAQANAPRAHANAPREGEPSSASISRHALSVVALHPGPSSSPQVHVSHLLSDTPYPSSLGCAPLAARSDTLDLWLAHCLGERHKCARHMCLTFGIAASTLVVALVVPDISIVFSLMGGTGVPCPPHPYPLRALPALHQISRFVHSALLTRRICASLCEQPPRTSVTSSPRLPRGSSASASRG